MGLAEALDLFTLCLLALCVHDMGLNLGLVVHFSNLLYSSMIVNQVPAGGAKQQ